MVKQKHLHLHVFFQQALAGWVQLLTTAWGTNNVKVHGIGFMVLWLVNQPPPNALMYPPRNSRPYDQGL